ncbi:GNAT family N-acetyltransferase [Heyndrickxia sp. NPDC080065]|uniref:GNAT family N-acetyltransferase n=1 Tax=Heyndrickxia sp. NPDC080065 TaxID=3390568 RepID=UPI003D02857B
MSSEIEIRVLKTNTELKMVQELEKEIWKMDPLPLHQTITASQNGGFLLGAFLHEEMVGFSYSFAGFSKGQSYLCSHMLGIHPRHQVKGIGARLKQAQMEIAQEMGYELITWTYDPLETRNANLNLNKLHAISSTYVENCYGEMEDSLNQGLPSDRLKVEWWINSPHVSEHFDLDQYEAQFLFQCELTEDHLPILMDPVDGFENNIDYNKPVFVPVPTNFQQLKSTNPELAIDWRHKTRTIFQTLFNKSYTVVSLIKSENEPIYYYIFVRKDILKI